jgi:PAS domain S-box-containing protein
MEATETGFSGKVPISHRLIIETIADLVFEMDAVGHFIQVFARNPAALFVPIDQLTQDKKISDFLPATLAMPMMQAIRKSLLAGTCEHLDYKSPYPDDNRWFRAEFYPTPFIDRVLVVIDDFTAEHQKELELESAHRQLVESKNLLQRMGEVAAVGGWEMDIETKNSLLTEVVYAIHETNAELFSLQKGVGFYHPDDQPTIAAAVDKLLTDGTPYDLELRIITAKGNLKWVRTTGQLDYFEGQAVRAYGVFQDISHFKVQQQKLIESEKRFNEAFYRANIGKALVDKQGRFMKVNPALCKLLGYSEQELQDLAFPDITHPDDLQADLQLAARLDAGEIESYELEKRYKHANGNWIWTFLSGSAVRSESGQTLYFIAQIQDITRRKQYEDDLLKAKEAAEAGTRSKSDFLSTMSHEVRTPLNGVIGMTHLLLEEDLTERQKSYVDILRFSAENLLVIVNDILDYNKIEAGKIELVSEPLQLTALLQKLVKSFQFQKKKEAIDIYLKMADDLPETIASDEVRLGQIINNLMSNAVKFTEKGSVCLQARVLSKNNKNAVLEIKVVDTGIGIAENQLQSIFEKFVQAGSYITRQYGGTGLGLAITQKLLHLMGGEIEVESQLGVGSTFTIRLPVELVNNRESAGNSVNNAHFTMDLSRCHILVAEDKLVNQKLVQQIIQKWGARLSLVNNGQEAVDFLAKEKVDLVLMDIQMPVMDGYAATALIKKQQPNLPVIALTASVLKTDDEKRKLFDAYLLKPFNPQILKDQLLQICARLHAEPLISD